MALNNSHQNQLNFDKSTESECNCIHSDDNFKNTKSKVHKLNTSEYKNDINHNGEVENDLSQKTEQTKVRKYFGNRKNNNYNKNNEFVRPAGLSSDRCTRDFMTAKNRKYYSDNTKMNDRYFDKKVYTKSNLDMNFDSDDILKNKDRDYESNNRNYNNNNNNNINNNSAANYIFKSNQILRNENRLRNTRHSDIFGINDERNLKRNILNQSKSYSDNTSNNSLDNDFKLNINSVENVSTYSLNSKDNIDKEYGYNLKDNDSLYSNNLDDCDELIDSLGKRAKKEDLFNNFQNENIDEKQNQNRHQINEYQYMNRNNRNSRLRDNSNSNDSNRDTDSDRSGNRNINKLDEFEDRNNMKDRLTRELSREVNNELKNKTNKENKQLEKLDKVDKDILLKFGNEQKLLGVVCLKLSGLKSETSEKDLETMCRCCKLQIVSINLDRNIITHTCTGTAKLRLKDPGQENLTNLQDLFNLQGFKFKI